MRFTAAAVVSGLAATVAAEAAIQHGPDSYGWGSSSAVESSSAPASSSTPAAAVTPSKSAPPVYTTEVVTAYTTYCPEATVITHKGSTYSVTSATTLTISYSGGITVTKPVYTTPAAATTPVAPTWSPAVSSPAVSKASSVPYNKPSSAPPATWATSSAPVSPTTPTPAPYKGAASKTTFGFAGLIAAVGLVAAL